MIIKLAIALVVVLTATAFTAWAFLPARHLPGHRARHLRIRLHLRLHPGKGFACAFSLHLRWSRFAVLRRPGRIRPALPPRYRFLDPREHSVFLGRAHYRHGLRVPLEEHVLVMARVHVFNPQYIGGVPSTFSWFRSKDARTPRPRSAARMRSRSRSPRRVSRTAPSGPPKPRTTCAGISALPPWPAMTCAP
jgi:hypothetical protein